ncbi:MAG TPA: LuxR C-terminal-related transcriptional regulator [Trebonia sp.]|jgi:predicted ATPase/DNA-binding CsgD family transcriptional regulator|nr:LuxR C-terminal-related transcriptional regulator [Trebonia sp.]
MTSAAVSAQAVSQRRRGQLPAEVTGFAGREAELARIATLLTAARLVTIVGPGGVGKTRVAYRCAQRAADGYPDGVWLVELSQLRDPALLANTVAACLGLPEQDSHGQLAAVLAHLRAKRLLLLLDTCEHLVEACALLAEAILREAPGVTVLATSRQALDAPGEHTVPVAPLPVRDAGDPPPTGAGAGDAVDLFVQRAASAVPGFQLTQANLPVVIRLCQRLDGIPLAIELAAVRLRALSLSELCQRLENRFRLLSGGRRGAVPRHQTLRTAVEWSHGLCTPAERALWARLSVFAGAFDPAAAEEVCAGDGLPREDIVHTLISLTEKSVVLRDGPSGERYRLLETLREFGAERLAEAGQEAIYRGRSLDRYLAMARYVRDHPLADDQVARCLELRGEHANLRAALEFGLDSQSRSIREKGSELAVALDGYWVASGLLAEGRYWIGKSLVHTPADSAEHAWALIVRGYLAAFAGDVREAVDDARTGIRVAKALGTAGDGIRARGYLYLNVALTLGGWHGEAAAAGVEAERQLTVAGDRTGLLLLDSLMAHLYQLTGRLDLAVSRCQQALELLGDSQERWLQGWLYTITAAAYFQQPGKERECAAAAVKGLCAKYELGDAIGIAYALEMLAWLAVGAERYDRAAWLIGAADPLWERAGKRLSGTEILEEFHQQAERAVSGRLGEKRFAALRAQGATRQLGEVVAAAAGNEDELLPGRSAAAGASAEESGLTGREQQIAGLVASGLSNREIAAQLVISKRTVDAHVEHIFAKLGISSRVQLTMLLREWLPRAREAADDQVGDQVGEPAP